MKSVLVLFLVVALVLCNPQKIYNEALLKASAPVVNKFLPVFLSSKKFKSFDAQVQQWNVSQIQGWFKQDNELNMGKKILPVTKFLMESYYKPLLRKIVPSISLEVENRYANAFYIDGGFFTPEDEKLTEEFQPQLTKLMNELQVYSPFQNQTYKIYLMDADDMIDAFSKGGNMIIVSSFVVKHLTDDAQFCLLGHEIAHMYKRHYVKFGIVDLIQKMLLEQVKNNTVWKTVMQISALAFKRDCEREADLWAVMHAKNANRDPLAMIDVLKEVEKKEGGFSALSSDHPRTSERIENVKVATTFFDVLEYKA